MSATGATLDSRGVTTRPPSRRPDVAVTVVDAIEATREALRAPRQRAAAIGLVPTMGALHAGHASLIQRSRQECGYVAVSIFVNPLQFDRPDDLAAYPQPLAADIALCDSLGVDLVFAPAPAQMYPGAPVCTVDPGAVADHLCGQNRPGHFRGVATVVMKLLQIVQPAAAYFGEKDAQQLAVIRRMVRDLDVPVRIVGVPTVREADGLALSSRNQRLDARERQLAPVLYDALREAATAIGEGVSDVDNVKRRARSRIPDAAGVRLEYLEVVDPGTFQPIARVGGAAVIAGALWVGATRLIDNVRWEA
jgi:pantoate--beta-alanine ligase